MNEEEIKHVAEDLVYLRDEWGGNIQEAQIRRGSGILRRLLVEDDYGKAWRSVGFKGEPSLLAVSLEGLISRYQASAIRVALAGGVLYQGVQMIGYLLAEQNGRPEFSIFLKESGDVVYGNGNFPGKERYSLSEFLRSAAGVAQGQKVSRRDIIKYIANVKSGVHSSGSQRQSEKTLISRMKKFEKKVIMNTPVVR